MQQALHPHLDLPAGLNQAFDHLIGGDLDATVRTLQATVAHLPMTSPSREVLGDILCSLRAPVSHDTEIAALCSLYGLLEATANPASQAV